MRDIIKREMIFVQPKVDNFWIILSHTLIIFLLSLFFFYFIVFVTKEKENCSKKLSILNVQITLLLLKRKELDVRKWT
jgi:membrane-associated HD superfamily phosphohydrolase